MAPYYKIHPAIGIARLGNNLDSFFVGPEVPGKQGVDIAVDNSETPVREYKTGGKIKRQAARFRVFEYDRDETGALTLVGEVTPSIAKIEWHVSIVNRKAALDHHPVSVNPLDGAHPAQPRNPGTPRNELIIEDPNPHVISGPSQSGVVFDQGQFFGKPVYLGELKTDASGRLLVLGGIGRSESVPPGQPLPSFINNNKWHDDVADGPVTATIIRSGQPARVVDAPAWASVAPPDFAPGIAGIVTLYDVALQAAYDIGYAAPAAKPSFRYHIRPVIERAFGLRWSNDWNAWSPLAPNFAKLADTSSAAAPARLAVFNKLTSPGLSHFVLPSFLKNYLEQWRDGNFVSGPSDYEVVETTPQQLDRSALEACVGANFYPGIEASITLRDQRIYSELCRLDHANTSQVYAGFITEIMAVPWQADFQECAVDWWPSQRPDIAMLNASAIPSSAADWANPIGSHNDMVENFQRLGFIEATEIGGQTVFVEAERDPAYPRV